MTEQGPRRTGRTKEQARAGFAAAVAFFCGDVAALTWTKRAFPDYAYTIACLVGIVVAGMARWAALRIMKRRP